MVLNYFQYNNSLAKSQDKIGGLYGNYEPFMIMS